MDSGRFESLLVDRILSKQKREYQEARSAQGNVQTPQVGASSSKRSVEDVEEPEQGPATKKHKSVPQAINDFNVSKPIQGYDASELMTTQESQEGCVDHDGHYWPTDPATGQLVPEEDMDFDTPPPELILHWGEEGYKSGLEGRDAETIMIYRGHAWIDKHLHGVPPPDSPPPESPPPESPPAAKKGRPRKTEAASKDKKGKGKATPATHQRRGPGRPRKDGKPSSSKPAPKPKAAKKTPAPEGQRGPGRPRKDADLTVAGKASQKTIAKKAPAGRKPAAASTHAMRTRSRGAVDE